MTSRIIVCAALLCTSLGALAPEQTVHAADVASQSCSAPAAGTTAESDDLASFTAITPLRLVDTRDGTGGVADPVGDGCTLRLDIGAASVPANARAVALSVTALGSQQGYLTVFPCSSGLPPTSNLNTRAGGFPTPNLVIAVPDADGAVCIYSLFEASLVVDLTGWWTPAGGQRLTTLSPTRVDDSREDTGGARVPADTIRTVPLSGVVPTDATAVVANLTVTDAAEAGFITAFPCGDVRPLASNLNFRAFESRAVAILVGLAPGAELCVSASVDMHVVVDVAGYYAPTPQFGPTTALSPVTGSRLADSRSGEGGWDGKFAAGQVRRLSPTAAFSNRSQSTAVVVNVVATEADAAGYVTVYPCDQPVPDSSAVNYEPGGESTNMVAVDLSSKGEICVFALAPVHLLVDLFAIVQAPDGALAERLSFDGYTWPRYTSDGTDYGVECGASRTALRIELLRSVAARVNGVPVRSGVIDLPTADDDLVRVELSRGARTQQLFFRCLPDGFPRLDVVRPGDPAPGWYLTTLRAPGGLFAAILDEHGAPVWYKRLDRFLVDFKLRADGRLLMVPELGPRYGVEPNRGYRVISLSGTLVDELTTVEADPRYPGVAFYTDHHDVVALANGARAMVSYPVVDGVDLRAFGPGYSASDSIADGVIQEITADDQLVWSWRLSDHFRPIESRLPIRWGPFPEYAGNEVDVYHVNSLAGTDDGSGDYVVSARHLDAVFRVDRDSGDVDWVLDSLGAGGSYESGAPRLKILGDPLGGPIHSHDARMQGDVLTIFDNRAGTGQPARAVAYRIDQAAMTATLLWQIREPQGRTSDTLGSNRITPDGSILIDWGAPIQPMFEEYTADRDLLMQIAQPGSSTYRIVKEPAAAFSAALLRATAGGTIEMP